MPILIQELSVDNVSWTPYAPPDDVNVVGLYNKDTTADLKFRTNSGDPTTEITIPAGQEKYWGDIAQTGQTGIRFPKNVTMGFLQSVAGVGPVKIESGR